MLQCDFQEDRKREVVNLQICTYQMNNDFKVIKRQRNIWHSYQLNNSLLGYSTTQQTGFNFDIQSS
jgi:hypothetical protein